jgi:uncharacterized protein (DUF1800 family)
VAEASKFMQRIAMGFDPLPEVDKDPLAWAVSQLTKTPEIRIYDQAGKQRELPEQYELKSEAQAIMVEFRNTWNAADEFFASPPQMPMPERRRLHRRLVGFPKEVVHWKEVQARLTTAQWSPQPVFERFWQFWCNHLMVAPTADNNDALVGPYQRHLRTKLTGSFRDLLWEAVTHPGMLTYLDNYRSVGPNSPARKSGKTTLSINENLGRELLELFTVSPAVGYTQKDVDACTLILTGWSIRAPNSNRPKPMFPNQNAPANTWGTSFEFNLHEPGTQTLMGKQYSAIFKQQGKLEDLVSDLAVHPATALHLARKLCTYFIDDAPPQDAVAHIEAAFNASRGHLPTVHKAVLEMSWKHLGKTRKLGPPDVWLVQCAKGMFTPLPQELPVENPGQEGRTGPLTTELLRDLGMPLPYCPQPDGWPIKSADWLSGEMLDRRARTAVYLAKNSELVLKNQAGRVQTLSDRTMTKGTPAQAAVQAYIERGELQEALTLWALSPDILWS